MGGNDRFFYLHRLNKAGTAGHRHRETVRGVNIQAVSDRGEANV